MREPEPDDLVRWDLGEVAVAHAHGALPGTQDTCDRSQCRRLPGAVAPDEGDDLALFHLERDAFQGLDVAVVGVDVLDLEDRHQATFAFPRYASMTSGSRWTASGTPSAIFVPWSSTVTRSEIPITTFMSCSIRRIVILRSSRRRRINCVMRAVSLGSIPAVGSSSSSSVGSVARARAISSRRWSP